MKKLPKPRNPYVQHLITKKQGPMVVTTKQLRKAQKQALKKLVKTTACEG
jgi:hypothetical protein